MAFTLPDLPYGYDALSRAIDEETMHLHHDKHHATYVSGLNTALKDHAFADLSVDQVLTRINEVPANVKQAVINSGGGHSNHSMFWVIMGPNGGGEPTGQLASDINSTFGSFDSFKSTFNDKGAKHFGSGWVWLILDTSGKLQVISTPNQNSPLMDGNYPLMGNDLWEHAYYLKYQNRRPEYLGAWWNVVNWEAIAKRYEQARAGMKK